MGPQEWALIIGALGGGSVLIGVLNNFFKWFTGRAGRERIRNTDLLKRADAADERADSEAAKRRMIQEYASRLRRHMYDEKLTPEEWPDIEKTMPARRPRK